MSVKGARLNSSSNLSSPTAEDNSEQTFEEIFRLLDVAIKNLLRQSDYTTPEVFRDLKLVQKQTRYSEDILLHHHVVDKIVHAGVGHVFLRSWHQLSAVDHLSDFEGMDGKVSSDEGEGSDEPDGADEAPGSGQGQGTDRGSEGSFRNLQYVLSIVWNCTDSSSRLCEALVRSSVVYEMLVQLSRPALVDVQHFSLEESTRLGSLTYRRIYLMKAYLGILHNICRHCPESPRMFRSAGASERLLPLVRYPHEVVRAKTYLALSYVGSADDVEASDDIVSFIASVLREALGSINHFVVRYAFWASEIASGINHLAINDANKVRLGKLGVIQLYASMLLSGDEEEKSLAASGIWILSFHAENKRILRSDPSLVKTLTQVASRCTTESISRSLRGALWVARPNPSLAQDGEENCFYGDDDDDNEDPAQEHVMISYHWSAQKMMVKVRDALYSHGYKVWFDVDNMRGSTLEAMALAVERSAVILICMSQSYKESPNCRTEAEYAFKTRKDIIPIVTERDFVPDGWLGMLAGTRLYFDFSPSTLREDPGLSQQPQSAVSSSSSSSSPFPAGGDAFAFQVERLVREIGTRGKKKKRSFERTGGEEAAGVEEEGPVVREQRQDLAAQKPSGVRSKIRVDSGVSSAEVASSIINQASPRCHKCGAIPDWGGFLPRFSISSSTPECEEPNIPPPLLPSPTPLHTYRKESSTPTVTAMTTSSLDGVCRWSAKQVSDWSEEIGLEGRSQFLLGFTGLELLSYKRMMEVAPESFYLTLRDAGLKLLYVLRFSEALSKLAK